MSPVDALLREVKATKLRENTHEIWELPNGKTFVRAKTPSDGRAQNNQLARLRRLLGITDFVFQEGERREKKTTPKQETVKRDNWWDFSQTVNKLNHE